MFRDDSGGASRYVGNDDSLLGRSRKMNGIETDATDGDHFQSGKLLQHMSGKGEAPPGIQKNVGIGKSADFFSIILRAVVIKRVLGD